MPAPVNNSYSNNNYGNEVNVNNTSNSEDSTFEPQDIPMNKTRSDWTAIQGGSPKAIDMLRGSMSQGSANPFEGDLQKISPDCLKTQGWTDTGMPAVNEEEITVLLDSGLQAKVDENGIQFEEFNTGEGMIAAWFKRPVGEVDFDNLAPGSIGYYGNATGIGSGKAEDGFIDSKTQSAMIATYNALQNADTEGLSEQQQANVEQVMEQIKPFLSIEQRSETDTDSQYGDLSLNNIQTSEDGNIELDYSRYGAGRARATIDGDQLNFEVSSPAYFLEQPGITTQNTIEETLDLSNPESWTPRQQRIASDLRIVLQNVDSETLTTDEQANIDSVLEKMKGVPVSIAVPPSLWPVDRISMPVYKTLDADGTNIKGSMDSGGE